MAHDGLYSFSLHGWRHAGNPITELAKEHKLRTKKSDTESMELVPHHGGRLTEKEDARVWEIHRRFEQHMEHWQENAETDKSVKEVRILEAGL